MVNLNITRVPTKDEQRNMQIIGQAQPKDKFTEELHKRKAQAGKKGLPFCDAAAKDDWTEQHRTESTRLIRKYGKGYLTKEAIIEYKQPKMDWEKYSNLDNFEVFQVKSMKDDDLSKRNNMPIARTLTVYKYQGYANTYTMMNSEQEAIMGARKKHDALWGRTEKSTNLPVPKVWAAGKDKAPNRK